MLDEKSYKKDESVKVLNFTTKGGFGEHFASSMIRSMIEFNNSENENSEQLSVVIKINPNKNKGPLDVSFQNEIKMYREVIPEMEKVLRNNGLNLKFTPE